MNVVYENNYFMRDKIYFICESFFSICDKIYFYSNKINLITEKNVMKRYRSKSASEGFKEMKEKVYKKLQHFFLLGICFFLESSEA